MRYIDMMVITIIIVLILSIVLVATTILLVDIMSKEKIQLEREKFYEGIDIKEKKKILLDIIGEEMDIYKVKYILFLDSPYLREDDIKEMINIVTTNTIKRITPVILSNLRYIYNIDTMEDTVSIIGDIVSMMVMEYATEINTPH